MKYTMIKNVTIRVENNEDAEKIWKQCKKMMDFGKALPLSMERQMIVQGFEPIEINLQVKEMYFEDLLAEITQLDLLKEFEVII